MNLKQKLEYHYKAFDRSALIPDPLQFVHLYTAKKEIETAAFISSVFAYGNVKQIINTLDKIFYAAGKSPYNFVYTYSSEDADKLRNIKHRFYAEDDIDSFFRIYKTVLHENDSLEKLFLKYYNPSDINIKNALNNFSKRFLSAAERITPGIKFMFPLPERGSTCKRMNLFLRWMVRKDELDPGIWSGVNPDKLIIPVDTHVARICKELKLTKKKNLSWNMAEEITENLKKFDPADPVKYDFAICHIGIRKMMF